jgi:hypothetical protein
MKHLHHQISGTTSSKFQILQILLTLKYLNYKGIKTNSDGDTLMWRKLREWKCMNMWCEEF